MSPIGSATSGMISATRRLDASARRVAALGGAADLPVEAVEQISATTQFKASAKAARAQDEMLGALLDILV